MRTKTVCLINGHPNADRRHFCATLTEAYAEGAKEFGHAVTRLNLGEMDIDFLRDPKDFERPPAPAIRHAQAMIAAAHHLCIIYPIWLGTMPALVKAFFEQVARHDFAIAAPEGSGWPRQMLKGRSARVIVTMGMPSAAYRLFMGAHGVKGFESGILGLAGFGPIRDTFIGGVHELREAAAARHIEQVYRFGTRAS